MCACVYNSANNISSVVSQFENDKLTQFFVQGGKKIEIPAPTYEGISDSSAITPELCTNAYELFGDRNRFEEVGGFPQLNKALDIDMVLVMSIWDDHYANMLWLDSIYPPEKEGEPGAARGDCPQDSGIPSEVEANYADAYVFTPIPCLSFPLLSSTPCFSNFPFILLYLIILTVNFSL